MLKILLLGLVLTAAVAEEPVKVPDPYGLGRRLAMVSALREAGVDLPKSPSDEEVENAYRQRFITPPPTSPAVTAAHEKYRKGFILRLSETELGELENLLTETRKAADGAAARVAAESAARELSQLNEQNAAMATEIAQLRSTIERANHKSEIERKAMADQATELRSDRAAFEARERHAALEVARADDPASEHTREFGSRASPVLERLPEDEIAQRIIEVAAKSGVKIPASEAADAVRALRALGREHSVGLTTLTAAYLVHRTQLGKSHQEALSQMASGLKD